MKTNELMIGDIVSYNGEHWEIVGILGNVEMVQLFPCNIKNKRGLYHLPCSIHIGEITPILLTEEILKAIGFEFDEIDETWTHKDCPFELFDPWNKDGGYVLSGYNTIEFRYVHEIQNAFNLSGTTVAASANRPEAALFV